jgi:hypothetical protein
LSKGQFFSAADLFLEDPAEKFCQELAALRKKIIGSILEVLSSLGDVAVKNFPTQQKTFTQTYPRLFPGKMVRRRRRKKSEIFCFNTPVEYKCQHKFEI